MDYCGRSLPLDELVGEAYVGLMRAVCRYDPDDATPFATYAIWWVRTTLVNHITQRHRNDHASECIPQ